MLIVLAGLPGAGKTTLARALAARLRALHLRIDTIEQALRSSEVLRGAVGPAGYVVGYALARDNLRLGATVIADSVNPLPQTREAWRAVAGDAGAALAEVEVICGDEAEHRRRVEGRTGDIAGLRMPTWDEVLARDYAPWTTPRIVIDTARDAPERLAEGLAADLAARLAAGQGGAPSDSQRKAP